MKKIIKLLTKSDQNNIKLFRKDKLTKKEYTKCSRKISKEFILILNELGFPYKNSLMKNDYRSAITLSLHVGIVDLKRIYKRYIKDSTDKQILMKHKILFIDKIRVLSGKKQLYGSQYKITGGKIKMLLIEKPNELDYRRKQIGVELIDKYLKSVKTKK